MGTFLVFLVLFWLLAVGAWYLLTRSVRKSDVDKIKSRLLGGSRKKTSAAKQGPALFTLDQQQPGVVVHNILQKLRWNVRLQEMIDQAGLKWNPIRTVHGCLALFLAGYLFGHFMLPDNFRFLEWIIGFAAGAVPITYIRRMRAKRLKRFEEIFPESLEFVARSMRAGHAFSVSLEMLHREFPEPLSGEFRRTFEEHNLGLPLDAALEKLAKRVPSLDVHFFVSAVLLQKRTGGNLAEILDKLAYVIRERFKLRGKIRAISAHGKITGIALTCIPIGVAAMMSMTNPEYIGFFFKDETGNMLLGVAVFFQLVGYLIIKKIVSIEV